MQPGVRRTGWRNDGCDSRVLGRGRCRSGCPAGRLLVLPGPRAPCAGCGARWSPPGAPLISVPESVLIFFVTGEDSKDLDGVGRVDFRGIWKYFEMKMICHVEEWSQGGPRGAHVSALEQRGVRGLRGAASGHPRHLSGRVCRQSRRRHSNITTHRPFPLGSAFVSMVEKQLWEDSRCLSTSRGCGLKPGALCASPPGPCRENAGVTRESLGARVRVLVVFCEAKWEAPVKRSCPAVHRPRQEKHGHGPLRGLFFFFFRNTVFI